MIVYNTTYTMQNEDARNFVIWATEVLMPRAQQSGQVKNGRMLRILNHHDQQTECFSILFEVQDNRVLHEWYVKEGAALVKELERTFQGKVVGFSTLMSDEF